MARKLRIAVLLALLASAAAVPAADARSGRCNSEPSSPRCQFWFGKVTFFADGDTIDVDVAGDGTHAERHIRMTGINAPELHRYSKYPSRRRGECHARAATLRLERLIRRGHRRVRLAAQHASSRSGPRPRRQVSVRIGGRWVDVNRILVAEGHALFLGNRAEWAWNRPYMRLAQRAAARRARIWNPRACGAVAPNAKLRLRLNYDADGNDGSNVNGEWARIYNDSPFRVRIGRWWFRDSAGGRYHFPRRASIPARGSVLVRMGRGRNRRGVFHWGLSGPPFENPVPARGSGDGGYLFDRRANLRAYDVYPCVYACG